MSITGGYRHFAPFGAGKLQLSCYTLLFHPLFTEFNYVQIQQSPSDQTRTSPSCDIASNLIVDECQKRNCVERPYRRDERPMIVKKLTHDTFLTRMDSVNFDQEGLPNKSIEAAGLSGNGYYH